MKGMGKGKQIKKQEEADMPTKETAAECHLGRRSCIKIDDYLSIEGSRIQKKKNPL